MKCPLRYVRERTQGADRRGGCACYSRTGAGACVAGRPGAPGRRARPGICRAMRASARKCAPAKCTIGVAIGMRKSGPGLDPAVPEPGFETLKGNEMNAQANKLLHLPLLAGSIAAIVISGIAIVSLASSPGSRNESAAFAEPAQVAAAAVSRNMRCAECGVIQSTRKIAARDESDGGYAPVRTAAGRRAEIEQAPAQNYEITIRLQDGSLRVITDAHSAAWRPGEAVTLIAGIDSQGK